MELQYFNANAEASAVVAALHEGGAVIVTNVMSSDQVERVNDELRPYLEACPPCKDDLLGKNTRRVGGLILKSRTYASLVTHPLMLAICDAFLKPNCSQYQVNATQAIQIGPGSPAQELHRDDLIYPLPHYRENLVFIISSIWAMNDFTDEIGATRIIPGSHQWEEDRMPREDEAVPATMPAGSAIIYLGTVYHGGGKNRTDRSRLGTYLGYSLGWLRQEENQYLRVPSHKVRELPQQVQRLVGYQVHMPAVGYTNISEMEDPTHLINNDLLMQTDRDF